MMLLVFFGLCYVLDTMRTPFEKKLKGLNEQ
jgi:hypothetical protein